MNQVVHSNQSIHWGGTIGSACTKLQSIHLTYRIGKWFLLYLWCRHYLLCLLYTLNGTEFDLQSWPLTCIYSYVSCLCTIQRPASQCHSFGLRDASRKRPQIHLCSSGLFWRESFSGKYAPRPCIFDAIHTYILGS